ncbi:MAG: FtsK/SpoIIIE domain-containing protein [Planctomycetota bacterium]|nr:FtsK/SpoIIIE domain-containing protein [Planctomycetota bacterium]
MAHLTIVDPVALGQGFSAFMQLADFDEALIGGRIWTDAGHIDKCLADLTEHMEKVIQKYLRNRYATIDEYNAKAGDLKEPYRFLMISDFPSGLSDLSLERLASVVSSGPPCGVHVLMYHDTRQKWPAAVDLGQLRRNGIVLKEAGEGFVEAHEGLDRGRALVEPLPEMPVVNALLDKLGRRAVEAKRVELSFSTVSPPTPADMWSRDTERGLRVPIGRSGADRLQELELGRGTAQHALIAGRTGSGKSTLFHVMITNTALWFSPQEVEFYLIDFKKGVEFKTYATHRLPHARVVAVESDREFGLSVLKRLDKELDRRGELFRKAGVQDLPGYRRSPGAEEMPRTLLLIDEFQEFFTEDDSVAQEASLLLDRFVRQGRAFGVHTILGSQTLSGVYTLAKSTLGQMGVRIALQCNESDSYLILSEDNAAARLLSRPGEAIYNGMSGMIEGNNPFQIVWLPDEEEAARLKEIAKRTDAEGRRPKANTVVFEGNAPARLEANEALQAAVADRAPAARPALRAWLGEPNAIKGPTEVRFTDAGGSHLIMLGQHRDAAFGMTCATIFSLAARIPPEKLRLILLDGSGGEAEYVAHLDRLARALPHELSVVQHREIPALIGELDRELSASQESGQPPSATRSSSSSGSSASAPCARRTTSPSPRAAMRPAPAASASPTSSARGPSSACTSPSGATPLLTPTAPSIAARSASSTCACSSR